MWLKRNIPNALTLGNLLCGCVAITRVFANDLQGAAYLVGLALVFDFFDGFAARLLKVSSPIGKDLDSLADMVTFGVVPGLVMYQLMQFVLRAVVDGPADAGWTIYPPLTALNDREAITRLTPLSYLAFLIPVFSCIRLAKFNNDTRQSDSFIGLPTPANAMVICSLPLIMNQTPAFFFWINIYSLAAIAVLFSLLLVAELPLFALKFKGFSWSDSQNRLRFVFLGLAVLLLLLLQVAALPLIILLYILLSIVNNLFIRKKH